MAIFGRIYTMVCESCHVIDKHYLRAGTEGWNYVCPHCKCGMYVIIHRSRNGHGNFQSFVTEDITGEPIELTSPAHRDKILEANNLTLDRYSDLERRKAKHKRDISVTNLVTYDNIMTELKRSRGEHS